MNHHSPRTVRGTLTRALDRALTLLASHVLERVLAWEEAAHLAHTAFAAAGVADQDGRFEVLIDTNGVTENDHIPTSTVTALLLFTDPDYREGTLFQCGTYLDALLLMKIHRSHGHRAVLLNEEYTTSDDHYVVLSTHPWATYSRT